MREGDRNLAFQQVDVVGADLGPQACQGLGAVLADDLLDDVLEEAEDHAGWHLPHVAIAPRDVGDAGGLVPHSRIVECAVGQRNAVTAAISNDRPVARRSAAIWTRSTEW